jgi:hypothetical protein
MLRVLCGFLAVFWLAGCTGMGGSVDEAVSNATLPYVGAIPKRPEHALKGSEFLKYIDGMTVEQREAAILAEFRAGNIPGFLRHLSAVHVDLERDGKKLKATYWVMPDYLAIGADDDYVYMPMNPLTAQRVADHYGFVLPTRKMVDDVFAQSKTHLKPLPLPPGSSMATTAYFKKHNDMIREEIAKAGHGALVTGHKKDVVLSNKLCSVKKRVAIYGWIQENGKAIQPLSVVHGETYADYSHGIRLVSNMMVVDGEEKAVVEVMQSLRLSPLVSDEGILRQTRIALDCTNC